MPGLSGLEVAQRLAADTRAGCRIVFVTAYDEFAVQAFEREAVDYLLKPVSDERLGRAVERLRRRAAVAFCLRARIPTSAMCFNVALRSCGMAGTDASSLRPRGTRARAR